MKSRYFRVHLIFLGIVLLLLCLVYYRYGSNLDSTCGQFRPRIAEESTKGSRDFPSPGVSFSKTSNPYKEQDEWRTFLRALDQYKRFHREKLAELKSSYITKIRTLTWSCTQSRCSGLGDQLLRIQFFLPLAMMSDRIFTIHWDSGLEESTKFLLPNKIDWSYFNRDRGMCDDNKHCSHHVYDSTSMWNFGWTEDEFEDFGKVLFSSVRHITVTGRVVVQNMNIINDSYDPGEDIARGMIKLGVKQILSKKVNNTVFCNHHPFWYGVFHKLGVNNIMEIPEISAGNIQAHDPWLYLSHTVFTYLFKFPHSLVSRVEEYQQSLGLHKNAYLSLHLRTGFLGTPDQEKWITRYMHSGSKLFTDKREWDCLVSHSIQLRDEILGPDAPIYISTDSYLVKDWVGTHYPNQHLVFGNWTLQHSQHNHNQCATRNSSGRLAMWLDFLTLAQGKVLVHAQSAFSINAGFLKPIPHVYHSWFLHDKELDCLASHRSGTVSCIC